MRRLRAESSKDEGRVFEGTNLSDAIREDKFEGRERGLELHGRAHCAG
jgi:hypothetical protein